MRKIIHDCDCTFGIHGCDVDDGLAILYFLGDPEAELLGVTTTYGNSTIDKVYPNTRRFLKEIGQERVPVYKGCGQPGGTDSEAARYLADMAEKYAGELELLVTGSVTNLLGASKLNPDFWKQVKQMVFMGGITEPLLFEKKEMKELNFSCDPAATFTALTGGTKTTILTGNNCLKVLFTREEYERRLSEPDSRIADYIRRETDYWFADNDRDYGIQGYYNWDVVAAAYLMHPELFEDHVHGYRLSEQDLATGFLRGCEQNGEENCRLNLATIGEKEAFCKNIYDTWLNVELPE